MVAQAIPLIAIATSMGMSVITDATKKITKKKLGGSIEIPKFHFGGFINTLRV